MKIYTLTTQYAQNYGAILQAHSLASYLNSLDNVECEVLQYLPNNYDKSWKFFQKPKTFRDLLKNIYMLLRIDLLIQRKKKQSIMRASINSLLPLSKQKYDRKSILKNPPKADAFVCGSDQIWNFKYREDPTYFLDFTKNMKNVKKIAYSPSMADSWKKDRYSAAKDYLKNLDYISLREYSTVKIAQQLTDKKVEHVLDPVFLKDKEYWINLAEKPNIKEPYIMCYFLSVTDLAVRTVKKISKITGLPILHVNLNALDKFHSKYDIRIASPTQFLGYISNAAYVCTNSFHCSAYSVIFNKNYCVIPKNMANERMISLQEMFKIKDRLITEDILETLSISNLQTDYSECEKIKDNVIAKSKNYLKKAICEKN